MSVRRSRRIAAGLALAGLVMLAAVAAGCGGGSSSSATTEAAPVTQPADTGASSSGSAEEETNTSNSGSVKSGLKLAFFSVGGNNTYLKAGIKGAQEAAAKYGATIQVYDGEFDGAKQLNQVMGAIASGDFDGFVLEANNPQQLCSAAKATLDAGIVLAVTNVPVCDAPYTEPYAGTVIFVGGQSEDVYTQWFEQGFKSAPSGEYATLVGPAVHGNTTRARAVLDELNPQYPDWKEVGFEATEYQASVALTKTEDILNKHPNVNVIFSSYGGHTPGIIAAVKAAGKTGQIKIYDLGGDSVMFKAVEDGTVESTEIYLPYEEQYRAVQAVVAKLSGLDELDGVPSTGTYWELCQDPKLQGLPCFATKDTLSQYTAIGLPEY